MNSNKEISQRISDLESVIKELREEIRQLRLTPPTVIVNPPPAVNQPQVQPYIPNYPWQQPWITYCNTATALPASGTFV